MIFPRPSICALLALCAFSSTLLVPRLVSAEDEELFFEETFANGTGAAKGYRTLDHVESASADGESFIKMTLAGKESLEGVRLPLPPVEGNRLMTVRAKVRGSGTYGPMIQAANGWTRLPEIALTSEWQEIVVPKALQAGKNNPVFYLVAMPIVVRQPGAVLEMRDFKASLSAPLRLPDSEVKPQRLEVHDYVKGLPVREIEGERALVSSKPLLTQEIAFPQTSRPITGFVRFHAASPEDRLQLCSRRGGAKQAIREINPVTTGWQWLVIPAVTAEEAGETITLEVWPKGEIGVAQFIMASDAEIDPASVGH